ncbi:MAG: hypothetical protein ACIAXF_03365 [Phycisphaerales bacterium JB063]
MPACNTAGPGVSRARDRRWCLGLWLAVVCGVLAGSPAAGQGLLDGSDGVGPAPSVEPSDGEVAFYLVQGWVRAGRVPADEALPSAPLTGVFGVYVTLREDGRLMGRGVALRPDLVDVVDVEGPSVDMAQLLAQATRNALREVERAQRRRAVELSITDEDIFEQSLRNLHGELMIDVQIGHHLVSVTLPAEGPADAVFGQFVPGFHGLRMTGSLMPSGDLIWPGNALMRNTSPRSQLVQLLDRQGFESEDIVDVARPAGPQLERFEVVHFLQAGPAQPPRQLIRGNVVVPRRALDTRGLNGIVERISRHMDSKIEVLNDGTLVMRGPYHPSYDRINPGLARLRQASLACFAIMVQSQSAQQRSVGDRLSRVRADRALRVAESLVPIAIPQNGEVQPVSAALLLLALCESPVEVDEDLRVALGEALMSLHMDGGGFRDTSSEEPDARLGRSTEAVITAALSSWYATMNEADPAVRRAVWQSMNELVEANRDDAGGVRLADLTWLSVAYSRAGRQVAGAMQAADAQEKLAQMQAFFADQMEHLLDQQVQGVPLMGPDDVAGGYVTHNAILGAAPDPTWESAMPLTVVATVLRDEGIVEPNDIFGPLLSAQLGARFIAQLLITDANAYYLRDVQAASGGVRRSLWDNTLDLDCSSMALIALSELQTSLHTLELRDARE